MMIVGGMSWAQYLGKVVITCPDVGAGPKLQSGYLLGHGINQF